MKKMVFKVSIYCAKCKTAILMAISKLQGIDQIELDAEKGTVTVIGEVDPVCVAEQLRKVRRPANIDSVGPHKKEEPKKKEDEKPKQCHTCITKAVIYTDYAPNCTIL